MTKVEKTKKLVEMLFKNNYGKPLVLTDSQAEIFDIIFSRKHPRNHVMCHTRFGKSMTVAIAVLLRASTFPEKWAIVAGTKEKSKIIMDYIIQHIFDNEYTRGKFIKDKGETDEDIRRYRNKSRLTFNVGEGLLGEIYICGAKDALGLGAPNVIEDESALIPDEDHALVMRMLGDSADNFLCKIGNPFNRNHFHKSSLDADYHQVNVDCYVGLEQGRIPHQQYLDEQKKISPKLYKILFENRFPDESEIDSEGWMNLFTQSMLEKAQQDAVGEGLPRIGVDVGHGGDSNSFVARYANYASILYEDNDEDVIGTGIKTLFFLDKLNVPPTNAYIDGTGVGTGTVDYLQRQKKKMVNSVILGGKPNSDKFENKRAEIYWRLMEWLNRGGKLEPDERWKELLNIKWRQNTKGRIQLMSKDDMRQLGVASPNIADALALTFAIHDLLYTKVTVKSKDLSELDEYRRRQVQTVQPYIGRK